jgi:hypothetical protein
MTFLELIIQAIVAAIMSSLLPFLQQEANAPTTATEAQDDATITQRAQDALAAYDRAGSGCAIPADRLPQQ